MKESQLSALRNRTTKTWYEVGIRLGMDSETALEIAHSEFESALEAASEDLGGAFNSSPLGTKWLEDKEPADEVEAQLLSLIEECSVNFEKEHIYAEEVSSFWNLSTLERFLEIQSINVVRFGVYMHYRNAIALYDNFDKAQVAAGELVDTLTPGFDMCHPNFHALSPHHPLPYEMISAVSTWYLHELAEKGLNNLQEILGESSSVNQEARRLRKLSMI